MDSNEEIIHKKNTEAAQKKFEKAKLLDEKLLKLKAQYNDLANQHIEIKVGHPNRDGYLEIMVLNPQIKPSAMELIGRQFLTNLQNELEHQIILAEEEMVKLFNIK